MTKNEIALTLALERADAMRFTALNALRRTERILRGTDHYYIVIGQDTMGEIREVCLGEYLRNTIAACDPETKFCVHWTEPKDPYFRTEPVGCWVDFVDLSAARAFRRLKTKEGKTVKLDSIPDLTWHPKNLKTN